MKKFFIISSAILLLILEVSFFANVKIIGVSPNIFLMFLIASSFIIPEKDLLYFTFFGSLFLDLFSPINFGVQILINLMIIFFVLLASYFIFSNVSFALLLVLAILSTVISDVFYGLALYLSGFKIDIVFFAKNFLASKIIVNSVIIMIIYPVVDLGWERISKIEGRVKLLR